MTTLYTFSDAYELAGKDQRARYETIDGTIYVGVQSGDNFYPVQDVPDLAEARNLIKVFEERIESRKPAAPSRFYTLQELLPTLTADARPYVDTVADAYVCGIEHAGELYPMLTASTAEEADAFAAELSNTLDYHFTPIAAIFDEAANEPATPQVPAADDEEARLLEGFTFVPNKGMATIYVGKRNRLYLKGGFSTQLGIKPRSRVLIAFNKAETAFAIVKPDSPAVTEEMRQAGYFVSNKMDVTCARLFRDFDLDKYEGVNFYADTASLSGNVVIFRR